RCEERTHRGARFGLSYRRQPVIPGGEAEEAQMEGTRGPQEENTMAASEVYYMNARSESPQTSLVAKMLTVFEAAGIDQLIKPGDLVAIKIHCGEWNNTAYLRPVYPRALGDRIKGLGGRPFGGYEQTLTYQPYASRAHEH